METRRFVVLRHEPGDAGPRKLHWDLMLECGDKLRTWALDSEPGYDTVISAAELPRHRISYLDFEGPLSDGRGTVVRFDRGFFEIVEDLPEKIIATIDGEVVRGRLQLTFDSMDQRWNVLFTSS